MMKKGLLLISLILISLVCQAQQRRALLVGIADYPEDSGWRKIHSDGDVSLLHDVLSDSFKIETLVNGKATYHNIISKLKALEAQTIPNDTVLILLSGHGQQMVAKGDEEPDSLDEAFIPYDAKANYSETYTGYNHLRDDVISESVNKIRKKAGKNGLVLVLLDACHSGDSYRDSKDSVFYRGGYPVFSPDTMMREVAPHELKDIIRIEGSENLANVLYVSACMSNQLNMEVHVDKEKWYGALSLAFSEAYKTHGLNNLELLCQGIKQNLSKHNKWHSQSPEFATNIQPFSVDTETEDDPTEPTPSSEKSFMDDLLSLFMDYGLYVALALALIALMIRILCRKK